MNDHFHTVFSGLCYKIAPLYILIILGFIAGRRLKVDRKTIANLLFYIVVPIVFFDFALQTKIHSNYLLIPFLFFFFSTVLSLTYLSISRKIWQEGALPNVLGFSAGSGNTGYFGLPVALMLFDSQTVSIYMLMNIGFSLFDYTSGAYIMARGRYTSKEAAMQVTKLPMIYAFLFGLMLNYCFGFELPYEVKELTEKMRSTYVVLGMMIIGLGMSTVHTLKFNFKFLAMMLSAKFIAAPLLMLTLIYLDKFYLNIFTPNIHQAALLMSLVPPAANTVVFATIHNAHPEEAATGIMIGTIIALVYLPAAIALFF